MSGVGGGRGRGGRGSRRQTLRLLRLRAALVGVALAPRRSLLGRIRIIGGLARVGRAGAQLKISLRRLQSVGHGRNVSSSFSTTGLGGHHLRGAALLLVLRVQLRRLLIVELLLLLVGMRCSLLELLDNVLILGFGFGGRGLGGFGLFLPGLGLLGRTSRRRVRLGLGSRFLGRQLLWMARLSGTELSGS